MSKKTKMQGLLELDVAIAKIIGYTDECADGTKANGLGYPCIVWPNKNGFKYFHPSQRCEDCLDAMQSWVELGESRGWSVNGPKPFGSYIWCDSKSPNGRESEAEGDTPWEALARAIVEFESDST